MSIYKIHILGNGKSVHYFDKSEGLRVGCNFTQPRYKPDWTMIADIKPIKKFYEGYRLCCPAILTERAHRFTVHKSVKLSKEFLDVIDVVEFIRWMDVCKQWGANSAQHATHYAIQRTPEVQEVHIWGCDSLWSSDIESSTDKIVHKNLEFMNTQNIYYVWRDYWDKIFSNSPNVQFTVHAPEKPFLKEAPNLKWNKV